MTATLAILAAAAAAASASPATPEDPETRRGSEIVVTGEATETTGDYTTKGQTTATRMPLSQRETPQSVSVVTAAQIRDFQLNDINALLSTVPGVNVEQAETDRVYYSARGFDIQTFQIDGVGLPFAFGVQTGSIDTAIYDHIEVLRGAPGLLSPTGNPSAVVNFVRKRPSTDFQASASAQYGSFDNVRLDADVSVPLTADGSIRARGVGAFLDTDSYLDRYHLRRWTAYGIIEADLSPNTVVSAGYGHQDHQSHGAMWGALPLYYTDGTRIDLPRSTNTGPDWAGWNVIDRQIFGDITQQLGNGWVAKFSAVRRAISENDKLFYVYGNPDRETGLGIYSYPGAYSGETLNLTLDAFVSGKVKLLGGEHEVTFGVNRSAQHYYQYEADAPAATNLSLPLSTVFDGSFPEPDFGTPYIGLDTHTTRETVYGLIRLHLADPLKLMLGGNVTRATSAGYSYGTPSDFKATKALPFVGATLDLGAHISAYASYATIYNPQTETSAEHTLLPPITGDNVEAGFKGEWLGGRLNASAAIFQARQNNTAQSIGFDSTTGQTIYEPVDATSQGIEFEFSGQLLPGVEATGGYTIMRIRGDDDQPVRTFVPRSTARLNVTYSPPAFAAVKLGASFQYQSRTYLEPGTVSSTTGDPVRITQKGYAILNLLARYDISPHVSVSANVENVTNVNYLTALNYDQAFYGAPRTVLGTIAWKY